MTKQFKISNGTFDQQMDVSPDAQQHILWSAATNLVHELHQINGRLHEYLDRAEKGDGIPSAVMSDMGKMLRQRADGISRASAQIAMFAEGVNGGAFDGYLGFNRNDLGPITEGDSFTGTRKFIIEDRQSGHQHVSVTEQNSGATVYMGVNTIQGEGKRGRFDQLNVLITPNDEKLLADDGSPIACVNLGDKVLYDNEGRGNKTRRWEREDLRQILRMAPVEMIDEADDPDGFELLVSEIQARLNTPDNP